MIMKTFNRAFNQIVIALTLSLYALPIAAHAGDRNDACGPVFEACAAQGYFKDEKAPVGKKIYLNCASPILNQNKAVDKVDIDPNGFDANNCRDYRKAKDKFDASWAQNHQKP
jgi:hypothetical protein